MLFSSGLLAGSRLLVLHCQGSWGCLGLNLMQTVPSQCSAVCKRIVGSAIVSLGLITRFINERIFLSLAPLLSPQVPRHPVFLQPFIQAFIAYLKCQVKSKKWCGLRGTGLRHFFLSTVPQGDCSGPALRGPSCWQWSCVSRRNQKGNTGVLIFTTAHNPSPLWDHQ